MKTFKKHTRKKILFSEVYGDAMTGQATLNVTVHPITGEHSLVAFLPVGWDISDVKVFVRGTIEDCREQYKRAKAFMTSNFR